MDIKYNGIYKLFVEIGPPENTWLEKEDSQVVIHKSGKVQKGIINLIENKTLENYEFQGNKLSWSNNESVAEYEYLEDYSLFKGWYQQINVDSKKYKSILLKETCLEIE